MKKSIFLLTCAALLISLGYSVARAQSTLPGAPLDVTPSPWTLAQTRTAAPTRTIRPTVTPRLTATAYPGPEPTTEPYPAIDQGVSAVQVVTLTATSDNTDLVIILLLALASIVALFMKIGREER